MKKGIFSLFLFLFLSINYVVGFNFNETFLGIEKNYNTTQLYLWDSNSPEYPVLNDLVIDRGDYSIYNGIIANYSERSCFNYSAINYTRDGWLWVTSVGGISAGCNNYQYIMFKFDDKQYLDQNSKIYIKGQAYETSVGTNQGPILYGKDSTIDTNQSCQFLLTSKIDDSANDQVKWLCSPNGNNSGKLQNNTLLWEHSPLHSFNKSSGKLDNYTTLHYDFSLLPSKNLSKIDGFDELVLIFWDTGSASGIQDLWRVDYLSTSLLGNSNNSLPDINVSASNFTYCLVNETLEIPLNISVSDNEGDTIYYSLNRVGWSNITDRVKFNNEICLGPLCHDDPVYDSMKPMGIGECDVQPYIDTMRYTGVYYNTSSHNLVRKFDRYGDEAWMLELNHLCDKDDKSYYHYTGQLANLYTGIMINKLLDAQELNVTYYDYSGYQLLQVRLHGNTSNVDVWYNDTIISTIPNPDQGLISYRISPFSGYYESVIYNMDGDSSKYFINQSPQEELVGYVGFKSIGKVILEFINFAGSNIIHSWTTNKPESITVDKAGRDYITLYYTDDYNKDKLDRYGTLNIPIVVYTGEQCKYVGLTGGAYKGVFGMIKELLGNNFKTYVDTVKDEYDNPDVDTEILYFLYIMLLLGLLIFGFISTHKLSLAVPLLLSSMAIGSIAFLIDNSGVLIVTLLGIAFSLAVPLSNSLGVWRD